MTNKNKTYMYINGCCTNPCTGLYFYFTSLPPIIYCYTEHQTGINFAFQNQHTVSTENLTQNN